MGAEQVEHLNRMGMVNVNIPEKLEADFKEFVNKVFPEAGEQQLSDLSIVWYAGIFSGTQVTALTQDLTGVHVAAYDVLSLHNEFSLEQIKRGC